VLQKTNSQLPEGNPKKFFYVSFKFSIVTITANSPAEWWQFSPTLAIELACRRFSGHLTI